MKSDSLSNGRPVNLETRAEPSVLIPPFVKAIAVRLAWAAAGDESEVYRLLSAPYAQGRVSREVRDALSQRFAFMRMLNAPLPVEDYTIMLVAVWLHIEEMYNQGKVMPDEIMQGLEKKAATLCAPGCRVDEDEIEDSDIVHE